MTMTLGFYLVLAMVSFSAQAGSLDFKVADTIIKVPASKVDFKTHADLCVAEAKFFVDSTYVDRAYGRAGTYRSIVGTCPVSLSVTEGSVQTIRRLLVSTAKNTAFVRTPGEVGEITDEERLEMIAKARAVAAKHESDFESMKVRSSQIQISISKDKEGTEVVHSLTEI